jgi:peptide/nickel transport system substrate-binding protein
MDAKKNPVEFTIVTASSSAERTEIAALIQQDLKKVGIEVQVVPIEFRALLDRVTRTHDFEGCLLAMGGGDADPNSEMSVLMSNGSMHLWNLGRSTPATEWEREIDELMQRQLTARDPKERKRCYDRVQQILAEQLPLIPLVSPHVLVGARTEVGNFRPAVMDHSTLWNVEELYLRPSGSTR